MGCELFAKSSPSPAVTAICVPPDVDGKKIVGHMRDNYGIMIAGGQDHLKGKIFRIGHLGFYDKLDVLPVLGAVELTLKALGHRCELGKAAGAAADFYLDSQ